MCGIFGGVVRGKILSDIVKTFTVDLAHRGPDGDGFYINEETGVFIGNTRLSIIDIESGQQPFVSDDNSVQCVQNGEVYNYQEINDRLTADGYIFKTKCDTESILASYLRHGIDGVCDFNGMFAIAIADTRTGDVYLVRDRLGVKPLYYYWDGTELIFCSEIKPILKHINKIEYNIHGFYSYLKYNYIIGPETIYKNIYQVRPGHYIRYNSKGLYEEKYWDLDQIEEEYSKYNDELVDNNCDILRDSISLRNRSDVPVGAFLSGGIDSSLICSIYSKEISNDLETYTIQFGDEDLDESRIASALASQLGVRNTCVKFPDNIELEWKGILSHLDQPHGDASFIPTSILCREYAKHLKVALTGDGGDEIFCGYDRYSKYKINGQVGDVLGTYMREVSIFQDDEISDILVEGCDQVSHRLNSQMTNYFENNAFKCSMNRLLYLDLKTILPDNNLIKPDRMGMMHSVESRNPFMDYRLAEFNFSIRKSYPEFKLKYALKKMLIDNVGAGIVPERKQMFSVPYSILKTNMLTSDRIIHQFARVYSLVENVFKYEATIQQIRENEERNEIRKLRNLMALFYWLAESKLN